MKSKHKSAVNIRRTGRPEAETQAELEEVSVEQLSHMGGGKAAKAALRQKTKIERG
jgi:hypothetical protein